MRGSLRSAAYRAVPLTFSRALMGGIDLPISGASSLGTGSLLFHCNRYVGDEVVPELVGLSLEYAVAERAQTPEDVPFGLDIDLRFGAVELGQPDLCDPPQASHHAIRIAGTGAAQIDGRGLFDERYIQSESRLNHTDLHGDRDDEIGFVDSHNALDAWHTGRHELRI